MIFLIIILLVIIEEVLDYNYKKTNAYCNEKKETEKFNNIPENIMFCNLGSSHARYALSYDDSDIIGFNFALPPQNLRYDFSVLKMYHKNMDRGCVVAIFLPICVFFLNRYQHSQTNYKYYYFLDKKYIEGYNWIIKNFYLNRPLLLMPWKVRYIFKDIHPAKMDSNGQEDVVLDREKSARDRILEWNEEFGLLERSNNQIPYEFKETTKILNDIIDYCIDKGFKPVLVIPPVSATMHEEIKNYNLNLNWMMYDQLTDDIFDKAPLFDYFSTLEFEDDSYYINADFLNDKGRRLFSEKFFTDVSNRL